MSLTAPVAAGWAERPGAAAFTSPAHPSTELTSLRVVVMGVSGSGKSALAERLARALGAEFVEGDELHPPRNVQRMAAGIALTDDDRQGWLQAIADRLHLAGLQQRSIVISCSALKRRYRDQLRQGASDTRFVHLHGSADLLAQRLAQRAGHYMPASLLPSQLRTLEPPDTDERAITLDITEPIDSLVQAAWAALTSTTTNTP